MSTEKTIVIPQWVFQNETVKWWTDKWWKVVRNTAWCIMLVFAINNSNAQCVVPAINAEFPNEQAYIWQDSVQVTVTDPTIISLASWGSKFHLYINWVLETDGDGFADVWDLVKIKPHTPWVETINIQWDCGNVTWFEPNEAMAPILPVTLTHFIAACERDGQQVRLNRGTASEVNNKGFWVQKSADWNKWDNIVFVEWIGNTWAINNYSIIDTEWTEWDDDGVVYYKLEQEDFDWSSNYSDVVKLRDCQSDTGYAVSLSPNPVSDILTVSINTSDREQAQTIYIINMMWQVIWTVSAGDANKVQIDMNALPSGTYTIKTIAGNGTDIVTQQVVKI